MVRMERAFIMRSTSSQATSGINEQEAVLCKAGCNLSLSMQIHFFQVLQEVMTVRSAIALLVC